MPVTVALMAGNRLRLQPLFIGFELLKMLERLNAEWA
ncbi:Uncharacterised protein [Vibrio cholerae]|uniref:Uncharacterized protein n=1 Tax=Vibrio cholerae TaxID=666 RepID=A0A655YFI7_VIBCL|nr:Uncharacterised protein [Vibrio cholerae]CSC36867.1 Uncharacterised protein [Vibrio cholerae]